MVSAVRHMVKSNLETSVVFEGKRPDVTEFAIVNLNFSVLHKLST